MDPTECLNKIDLQFSLDEREEQAAQYKPLRVKDLFPLNYMQQKKLFFEQECDYNPFFSYKMIVSPDPLFLHTDYLELAHKILRSNQHKGSQTPLLSKDEVLRRIEQYLEALGLQEYVEVRMEADCLSRTSVSFFKDKIVLKLRLPLDYTRTSLEGVLDHELGTHVVRAMNHKENCLRKPSAQSKVIQEGLAALNQSLCEEQPFLFKPALRYVSAVLASKMDFKLLYRALQKYVKEPEDCWRECVRVKRGIDDTSNLGGYYKDQHYLIGAVELLQNRHTIDFRKLFYGRVTPLESRTFTAGVLPPFLSNENKYKVYLKKLDTVALCNFIQ